MFGEGHGESIARRALEEALACQDVLAPAPPRASALTRARSRLAAITRGPGRRLALRPTIRRASPRLEPPVGG